MKSILEELKQYMKIDEVTALFQRSQVNQVLSAIEIFRKI